MKKADRLTLLACALVATCLGGVAEAKRSVPGADKRPAHTEAQGHRTEARPARGQKLEATRGHSTATASGRVLRATWQTYGRSGRFSTGSRIGSGRSGGGGIQCVTFARADTGIELSGNANTWWDHAAGVYARGNAPENGAVLNFRANRAMRMGHVAVVNEVVDGRTVIIDHANWGGPGAVRGGVSRDISVVDVSPNNDWSAVRVALGHSEEYGSIYPTFGFIYNRPDNGGTMTASNESVTAIPALNKPPRDLRPAREQYDEVAEAPDAPSAPAAHRSFHRHRGLTINSHHTKRN